MCEILKVNESTYYYKSKTIKTNDDLLAKEIVSIFNENRQVFWTRKIKEILKTKNIIVSRRKIGRIMKEKGLISTYTTKQYRRHNDNVNENIIANVVNRKFDNKEHLEIIVSDLTYVRVGNKWHYICLIVDLFNREFIGYSVGKHKAAELVHIAFSRIKYPLDKIKVFHTDRGSEFKNKTIESILTTFNIQRSLSKKGSPYDNAVAEAAMKVIKTEFIYQETFLTLNELELKLFDYINWYNNVRIHGSLNYQTPINYRKQYSL